MTDLPTSQSTRRMSRWTAAGLHLVVSIVVVGLVAAWLIGVWYSWELFALLKADRLLGILAGIDVIVGPLLTLIVFRAGKPSLRFDLTVIALLQAGFLAYGVWIMAQSRPAFVIGVHDRFEVLFANEVDPLRLALSPLPEARSLPWNGPLWLGGQLGQDAQETLQLALDGVAGEDVHQKPERYIALDRVAFGIAQNGRPLAQLTTDPGVRRRIEQLLQNESLPIDQVRFVPLVSRRADGAVLMDRRDGRVLGIVPGDPWNVPATDPFGTK